MARSIFVALVIGNSVVLTGCQPKPEDETLLSWNTYVEDAKSGKAAYFQELSADMKKHDFSYEWQSAKYYPRTKSAEIKILVTPPERQPYTVGLQFEMKNGQWVQAKAFDYRKNRVTPEEPEQSPELDSGSPGNPLKELPADTTQAWKDAGGTRLGWIDRLSSGVVAWIDDSHANADDIPAFIFEQGWNSQTNGPLPDPGFPFGVVLRHLEKPDSDIARFAEFAPSENLAALDLRLNAVTAAGVRELQAFRGLRALSLGQTAITDDMLAELEAVSGLIWLDLGDASSAKQDGRLTEIGMAHLGQLPKLEFLCLSGSGIDDAGVRELAALEGLKGLRLFRTRVTVRGLDHLVDLKNLQYLDLASTAVRDEAGALIQLTNLKTLHLTRSFNTDELEKVRQALPNCEIHLY